MIYMEPVSGFKVSNVVLGCMRIGGLEDARLHALLDAALASGINYVDHADIYGGGQCEKRFGELLHSRPGLRDQLIIQTKCGICQGYYDSSKEHILSSVEGSLRRLSIDHLDVLLIHRPDALFEADEIAEAFDRLASSGKVRYFGVSNHNPEQIELLRQAVGQRLIINQLQLSVMHSGMVDRGINVNTRFDGALDRDGGVLDYCKLHKMILQAWSPFQYGFFEGAFVDCEKFPVLNDALAELAEQYGVTKTGIAAAWIARLPALTQIIAGTTSPDRLKEIAAGANIVLTRPDWYKLYLAAGNKLP